MRTSMSAALAVLMVMTAGASWSEEPRAVAPPLRVGPGGDLFRVPEALRISGETKYQLHDLVSLKAEGVDPKAAILWRVFPPTGIQQAVTPRGMFQAAAKPGTYLIDLMVIRKNGEDGLDIDTAQVTITVESCQPVPPIIVPPKPEPRDPPPKVDPKPEGKPDALKALGRIQFGNSGCTATVVGPRRADGRWDVLTAAHCMKGNGERGTISLKDGRSLRIRVVVHERASDIAWCVTEDADLKDVPFANLARANPETGTKIWHNGYGVDKPGNREDGVVSSAENSQGQIRMTLSVSSGDSGGGIFRTDTDELISVVCCTSAMAQRVSMWGGSVERARRLRPGATVSLEWPTEIPLCDGSGKKLPTGLIWESTPIPEYPSGPPTRIPYFGDHR